MPYEIRMTGGRLIARFFGDISAEDVRQSLAEVEAIEAAHEVTPDRITDLSESGAANLSYALIEELALRRRAAKLRNTVKSAICAPTAVQFGYARMFQTLNDNPRIVVAIFRDRAEAERWLGDGAAR